jgi:hypothetical protein|tara:strand:- start:25 stop:189 length:165 start_codon:yes stop_codon:yes gene_type:complete
MKDNKIKIVEITESEEGHTNVQLEIKSNEYELIFEYGLITMLKNSIKSADDIWK